VTEKELEAMNSATRATLKMTEAMDEMTKAILNMAEQVLAWTNEFTALLQAEGYHWDDKSEEWTRKT